MTEGIFSYNLKFYRTQKKLTQKELGELSGIGQVSITNYEKGKRFPNEKNLIILAKALGISPHMLFVNPGIKNNKSIDTMFSVEELISILLNGTSMDAYSYLLSWGEVSNLDLREIFSNIIVKVLIETGNRWESGDFSISEEHIISGKVREVITLISAKYTDYKVKNNKTWLGFCSPTDQHDLLLLMTSNYARSLGWETFFVGLQVPVKDILELINRVKPNVITISISMERLKDGLEAYLELLDEKIKCKTEIHICGRGADPKFIEMYPKVTRCITTFDEVCNYLEEK